MKKFSFVVVLLIILTLCSNLALALKDDKSNFNMNFVIVLDNSGSLYTTDPNRKCVEGAKLFVDLLPMEGSQIGVVTFGNGVSVKYAIQDTGSIAQRQAVKSAIAAGMDYSQDLTDIGAALSKAVAMLQEQKKPNSGILLFTDGSLRTYSDKKQEAQQQIDGAVETCRKNDWPIYTIGLNANGGADINQLGEISRNTGAGDPLIASAAEQMAEYFTDVFSQYMDINAPERTLTIQNGYVEDQFSQPPRASETDIVITGDEIGQVSLWDPSQAAVTFGKDSGCYLIQENSYTLIKMVHPNAGQWRLRVEGNEGQKILVQTMNAYDMPLSVHLSGTDLKKNSSLGIDAYLSDDGARLVDGDYYKITSADAIVMDETTSVKTTVPMQVSEKGYSLSLPMQKGGKYTVQVAVKTPDFKRTSDEFEISVGNQPPLQAAALKDMTVKVGAKARVDLKDYFTDADGDTLQYDLKTSCPVDSKITFDGSVMAVAASLKEESTTVTVTARDNDGAEAAQTFSFKTVNAPLIVHSAAPIDLIAGQSTTLKLSGLFTDPDGQTIQIALADPAGKACAFAQDAAAGTLTIRAVSAGKASVRLTATDCAGSTAEQSIQVRVVSVFAYYGARFWPFPAGLLLLLLLVFMVRKARCRVRGKFVVSATVSGGEDGGYPTPFPPQIMTPTKNKFGRKQMEFTLYDVLLVYYNGLEDYSVESEQLKQEEFRTIVFKGSVFGTLAKVAAAKKNSALTAAPALPAKFKPGSLMTFTLKKSGETTVVIKYQL